MISRRQFGLLGACALLLLTLVCKSSSVAVADAFTPPLTAADLDNSATAEWVDGHETPRPDVLPSAMVYLPPVHLKPIRVRFGATPTPGIRHLRFGFNRPIPVGAVILCGNCSVSALAPKAAYPGNLGADDQWIPAQRLPSDTLPIWTPESLSYFVWILPPGTTTRALRFTCASPQSASDYAGQLYNYVSILGGRFANIAPEATILTSSNSVEAVKITNRFNERHLSWSNGAQGASEVISPQNPEWVELIWNTPVSLRGLCALWAGFSAADVQYYPDSASRPPREAHEEDWVTLKSSPFETGYPVICVPNWIDFGKTVSTRAIRLRITAPTAPVATDPSDKTKGGHRIWLGELFALQPLGATLFSSMVARASGENGHPPIPVRFTLDKPGYVTLVIEDAQGKRIRNLVSETPFPAGINTAWWDGADDLGRDTQYAAHGAYYIPGAFVQPGTYHVRGLVRDKLSVKYQMAVNTAGNPPWRTADRTGGWLADHTPPSTVLYVPGKRQMLIGSSIAEYGDSLISTDLNGRKRNGWRWLAGGLWSGASFLARDDGARGVPGVYAYAGSAWQQDADKTKGEIRLLAISDQGQKPVLIYKLAQRADADLGGIAVYNGLLVASLPALQQLLFVDAAQGRVLGTASLLAPRGVAFDRQGRLLVVSGKRVVRCAVSASGGAINQFTPENVVNADLDEPQQIALDSNGNLYISDRGSSHCVKVFQSNGTLIRSIGTPELPKAGPYNPTHMNNPNGLTLTDEGHLWVAETDFQPKRVSVWTLDGKLERAFYGPPEYGGGGRPDPVDPGRYYYHGMEFKLDASQGTSQLIQVYCRPGAGDPVLPRGALPDTPIYFHGHQYMTDTFNANPTNGATITSLWLMRNGLAVPVAIMGRTSDWDLFKTEPFRTHLASASTRNAVPLFFVWSDKNGDGKIQAEEISFLPEQEGFVTVQQDLSFVTIMGKRFAPREFRPDGIPIYDANTAETVFSGGQPPASSGGGQVLLCKDNRIVITNGAKPFARESLCGAVNGQPDWQYPSLWPGLHPSHDAPLPQFPGELIGTTRLLGYPVTPRHSDAGEIWAINGNMGNVYLFTTDGLCVATLFRDTRLTGWSMPEAHAGMDVSDASIGPEDFWPTITQTPDGNIWLTVMVSCLVKVEGLESIHRLPTSTLTVTDTHIGAARQYLLQKEQERQQTIGRDVLQVGIQAAPIVVDGKLDDWSRAHWVTVDSLGDATSGHSAASIQAAVAVSGDRLYAAFRTGEPTLLRNSGESPQMLFKTGGALDISLGVSPNAPSNRMAPVEGDERLLITLVQGKPKAMLYRAVVSDAKIPVAFTSPGRSITFDRVDDVSAEVQIAASPTGDFEVSVPLRTLGLTPKAGLVLQGDIGVLRGNGFQTLRRVYWNNKSTGLISDVPGEAMLSPQLWGLWRFEAN